MSGRRTSTRRSSDHRQPWRWLLLLVVVLALPLGLGIAAQVADGSSDPQRAQASSRRADLQQLRGEIGVLERRLRGLRERESTLEQQLERLDLELELQEAQVEEATTALELAHSELRSTAEQVRRLEGDLLGVQNDLRQRLGGLYRLGREGYLRLFLSLQADTGLLPAIRQLRYLARRDQESIEAYRRTLAELERERELLVQRENEVRQWQEQEQERRDRLTQHRKERAALRARVERERVRVTRQSDSLQAKERKLAGLINSVAGGPGTPLEGSSIRRYSGALDWPLPGAKVLGRFGPRRDPRYRTEVPHNGIDLEAEPGAEVRSVFPGQVVYAGSFEGYGPMVVVSHPGRVFSVYAGLASLRTAKGDVLSLGDVVGLAAEKLYFEIRNEQNQPEDPLQWLR